MNFILIGRSGAGKGTQVQLLVKYFGSLEGDSRLDLYRVSTGQLLRNLAKEETDLGYRIKKVIEEGKLPPAEVTTGLWLSDLAAHVRVNQGIIFDGAPRQLEEAKNLERVLKFMERFDNTKVLLVEISREEAVKRLKLRARSDDTDEVIDNRLAFYDAHVAKVAEYFDSLGKLVRINGEQSIEAIHEEIKSKL